MAIRSKGDIKTASYYYLLWYIVFSLGAVGIGLAARVLLPELVSTDTELALPLLALDLLPQLFVGGILAGIFSATISTADSQIIACSSAITQDLVPNYKQSFAASKIFTLFTMGCAVCIALFASNSVYYLVVLGWSACAVVLGPLVICRCFDLKLTECTGITMILVGIATVIVWTLVVDLSSAVNETLPGWIAVLTIYLVSKIKKGTRHG